MIWTTTTQYHPHPFDKEAELEQAISELMTPLLGESSIYLDVKKLIAEKGKTRNIPDGYLLDFSSPRKPVLYLSAALSLCRLHANTLTNGVGLSDSGCAIGVARIDMQIHT